LPWLLLHCQQLWGSLQKRRHQLHLLTQQQPRLVVVKLQDSCQQALLLLQQLLFHRLLLVCHRGSRLQQTQPARSQNSSSSRKSLWTAKGTAAMPRDLREWLGPAMRSQQQQQQQVQQQPKPNQKQPPSTKMLVLPADSSSSSRCK
jgi:hypothetical protein